MVMPRRALHLDKASCWQSRSLNYLLYCFLYPNLQSLVFGLFTDWDYLYWLLAFSCTKHCSSGSAEVKKQQPTDPLAHFLKLCFFRRAGVLFEADGSNVIVNFFIVWRDYCNSPATAIQIIPN